ncbi:histidinol-phosphate transaminase [Natranaerobius trueperi]|nr:histidinol-phosphate transaminase [Natranaerobius trueperi]
MESLARRSILNLNKYVQGTTFEQVKKQYNLDNITKLSSNENPHGPSERAFKAIEEHSKNVSVYPDGSYQDLKERLSKLNNLDVNNIVLGNGSDELIKLLLAAFLNPGEKVITADITFSVYKHACTMMDGEIVKVPLKNFTHDLNGILDAITPNTKMIFICNPNNPTGTIVTHEQVQSFLDKLPSEVIVVFDEAYCEYVSSPNFPNTLEFIRQGYPVVSLRTFSKLYGLAGLRVGYGFAPKEVVDIIEKVRVPFNVNLIGYKAALASLDDTFHTKFSIKENNNGKVYLKNELEKLGLEVEPTEANFLLINVKGDDLKVTEELIKRGVIVRSGSHLGIKGYIRVTIGRREDNERLVEALSKINFQF